MVKRTQGFQGSVMVSVMPRVAGAGFVPSDDLDTLLDGSRKCIRTKQIPDILMIVDDDTTVDIEEVSMACTILGNTILVKLKLWELDSI